MRGYIIVMTYAHFSAEELRDFAPRVAIVDENNRLIQVLPEEIPGTIALSTR